MRLIVGTTKLNIQQNSFGICFEARIGTGFEDRLQTRLLNLR